MVIIPKIPRSYRNKIFVAFARHEFGGFSPDSDEAVFRCSFTLFFSVAYILQLYSAASLPATAVYPIVTGGSIVFTMMAGWIFFHERPGAKMLVAAGLSFCGTCLFL